MTDPELEHYAVADRLRPGAQVLDIGASVGQFAIPARDAGADVDCVEPLPDNVRLLEAAGFHVWAVAAGGGNGDCWLVEGQGDARTTGSYTVLAGDGFAPAGARWLTMVSLARLVAGRQGSLDVVKVDIEGGEYDLIAGAARATLERIDCLTIDTHRWTTPDEPEEPGIGRRAGPPYRPGSFDALVARLRATHTVTVIGPPDNGAVVLAVRDRP